VYVAADELRTPVSQLRSKRRSRKEVLARAVVVRCAESFGFSDFSIASALGLSPQAVSALRRREAAAPDVDQAAQRVSRRLAIVAAHASTEDGVIHRS
jgi:hypothetical protein